MSYDRTAALAYVTGEHASLFTELSVGTTDEQTGAKGILDRSFRTLGVAQGDLATASVDDADAEKLEALLDYNAMLRFTRAAANRVSVQRGTGGDIVRKERQQLADHLEKLLADAAESCAVLGVAVDGNTFEVGSMNLDILEPLPGRISGDGEWWPGGWP